MATKREQILAALKTSLTGTTGAGTRIYRSRVEPFVRGESIAVVLEPVSDTPTDQTIYEKITWDFRVRISVIVRGSIPDSNADSTIESLHTKVMTDTTIGGLAIDIRPSTTTFEIVEADQPAGVISCEYDIEYRTSFNDLST
tara:strand:+ start:436 stop:861 length:426 start_codon:yes stop_codon:yes gene_type:complete